MGALNVDSGVMKQRTKQFSLRVVRLVSSLPATDVARTIGRQLLRAGTSVGANYRAACRARSPKEFRAKLGIVEEEADESLFWLDLLADAEIVKRERLDDLIAEGNEILSIVVSSIRTSRDNEGRSDG